MIIKNNLINTVHMTTVQHATTSSIQLLQHLFLLLVWNASYGYSSLANKRE